MVEKIIELAKENLSIDGEITATSSFKEDLEVDSLDLMELVMALEDEFNVEIPSEELQNIKTVQDVADYLKLSILLFREAWHGWLIIIWQLLCQMPEDLEL